MTVPIRRPIIGGNWKMNTDLAEARALAAALVERIGDADGVDVVICPPFTNIQAVAEILAPTPLLVGAQDVFWEPKGAFTGEISPAMLLSVGASYVIAGHSERRHVLGETNEIVNRKARAAIHAGLRVILCVGEMEDERTSGRTEAVLAEQLTGSLLGFESTDVDAMVIAYEPCWAIGTGLTASTAQAQEAHAFIRQWLAERFGPEQAESLRIQYGGSVTAANAFDLLGMPDVDGALVGGASLKPDDFAAIVAAQTRVIAA